MRVEQRTKGAKEYKHDCDNNLTITNPHNKTNGMRYFVKFVSHNTKSDFCYPIKYKSKWLPKEKNIVDAILKDLGGTLEPNDVNWVSCLNFSVSLSVKVELPQFFAMMSNRQIVVDGWNSAVIEVVVPDNFLEKYLYLEYECRNNEKPEIVVRYRLEWKEIIKDWKSAGYPICWGFSEEEGEKIHKEDILKNSDYLTEDEYPFDFDKNGKLIYRK